MAILHPFSAIRPTADAAPRVACVPYDVVNIGEARRLAQGNPDSFLHVIRPEIDLPVETDEHDDAVYARGAENLRSYIDGPLSIQDDQPSLYIYRLVMDGRAQTGVFGCVSVKDYDTDVILKHEKTRPTKEDDRTRHIVSQRAHAEPVMLTFRDNEYVQAVLDETTASEPIYDFDSPDDIRHTIWNVRQPDRLVTAFSEIDKLYVADGHHRCKAASRAAEAMEDRTGVSDEVGFFPAVLFPMRSMRILAYNRIFRKLPDPTESFLRKLTAAFENEQASAPEPKARGEVCVYAGRRWTKIRLPPAGDSPIDALDVGRLSAQILEPMLGITDPRTDPNIDFVGGIRGTEELERIVDSGEAALAISMYPTSIEELVAVSDAGLLMPPKSTWFEPKLRSGLLVHLF